MNAAGLVPVVDLGDNVVLTWALKKARRDPKTFGIAIVYLGALYGIAAILSFFWRPVTPGDWSKLWNVLHLIALSANSFLLLLVAPLGLAQALVVEREKRTFDHLRMTAQSGLTLAVGNVAAAYAVPILLGLASIPHVVMGCFSTEAGGLLGTFSAYAALIANSLWYTTLSGLLVFLPKKAAKASAIVVVVTGCLSGVSALGRYAPGFEVLSLFGQFAGIAGDEMREVPFFGAHVPPLLVQVPLNLLLALLSLTALARKIEDDAPGIVGPVESMILGGVLAVLAVATYLPHPSLASGFYYQTRMVAELAAVRFLVLLFVTLPVASDNALAYEDLVRGLARARGEPRRASERLRIAHSLAAVAVIFLGLALGMALCLEPGERKLAYFVAGLCAASYLGVAVLAFQAARLLFPFKAPNVIASSGLAFLWVAPLVASGALKAIVTFFGVSIPAFLYALPSVFCPFVIVVKTAQAITPNTLEPVDPLSLALVATFLNVLMGGGLAVLIARAIAQASEFASTLVVLPADTFAAPGTMERRCERGHVYSAKWDSCPHCPAAVTA
ncbi:hypothetical protein HY251_14485 [bacterium]|nr:hypothetical protein [bacterium]